jgi:hypothetical protein
MNPMAIQSAALGAGTETAHYVDWGAIIAGAALASGISILLFTFGTAIGLSMVSPWEGEGATTTAYFVTLGLWTLWVVVSSFLAGGYIAGRMRRRIGDGTEHEVDVRDAIHGLVVWAVGLLIAALLVAHGVTSAAGIASKSAGLAAGAAMGAASDDVNSYTIDQLLRPTAASAVTPAEASTDGSQEANAAPARQPREAQMERQEIGRVLTHASARNGLSADNKTYLAQRVAARTGLTQAEAEARVNQVLTDAKIAADKARKFGLILGFLTAAALAVAAAAAAWAAALGGRHRDQGTDHSAFWRWR